MNSIIEDIGKFGIIAAAKIEDVNDAVPVAKAVLNGGLPVLEITFRSAVAADAIREIITEFPDMILGAGTILTVDQAKQAVEAGAKYLVSPGISPEVLKYCVDNDIPVIPGCSNPTDIETALKYGIEVIKFFPAEAFGGLAAMKSFSGPYPNILYIPTGGIDDNNLADYLAYPKTIAVNGSWLTKPEIIKEKKFDEITRLTRNTVQKVLGFEFAHIGINTKSEEEALKIANLFFKIFNFGLNIGNSSVFAGTNVEVNKSKGLGSMGHIAIKTNSIKRAITYLERQDIQIDMSTAKMKNNKMIAVYLKEEIGGFAIHLLQK